MAERISQEVPDSTGVINSTKRTLSIGQSQPLRISAGHRILHHDGKCSRPHGHNYEISIKITGELSEEGWIVDKKQVTDVVDQWDHRFLLEEGDPLIDAFEASGDGNAVVVLNHPPTAEVMSVVLERRLLNRLPETVAEVTVEVQETKELCATC
jgi:6-pyruvoyltetrahydropterin/6-carboxytetrahydropterin synthase